MKTEFIIIFLGSEKFRPGKLLGHTEIMSQGETFEELEENMKGALYLIMAPTNNKR
jgi:hypothetical protein